MNHVEQLEKELAEARRLERLSRGQCEAWQESCKTLTTERDAAIAGAAAKHQAMEAVKDMLESDEADSLECKCGNINGEFGCPRCSYLIKHQNIVNRAMSQDIGVKFLSRLQAAEEERQQLATILDTGPNCSNAEAAIGTLRAYCDCAAARDKLRPLGDALLSLLEDHAHFIPNGPGTRLTELARQWRQAAAA